MSFSHEMIIVLTHKIILFTFHFLFSAWLIQIVRAFSAVLLLALSLGAFDHADARPSFFAGGSGKVNCSTIEAQILAQVPIPVTEPKSYTESVRSLVVCNRIVTYHTCRRAKSCGNLAEVKAMYDFSDCFAKRVMENPVCGFPISCC